METIHTLAVSSSNCLFLFFLNLFQLFRGNEIDVPSTRLPAENEIKQRSNFYGYGNALYFIVRSAYQDSPDKVISLISVSKVLPNSSFFLRYTNLFLLLLVKSK